MSGRQVGAIVGQVVGAYFGFGPVGSAIGGVIGGAIGGLFDPDTVNYGPKLTDLKVQTSTYGNAVPIVYGTMRIAGNLIWSGERREMANETEQQGKGGPSVSQIDYTYEQDAAIALGEFEIIGITQMYANGVLIYDVAVGASPATIFANGQWARGQYFYTGSETQLPDPIIEAAVGVGNCEAYRGTSYIVFDSLQLNTLKTATIPNFEFVVITDGTSTQYERKLAVEMDQEYASNVIGTSNPYPRITAIDGTIRISNSDNPLVYTFDLDGNATGAETRNEFEAQYPAYQLLIPGPAFQWGFWLMFDGTAAWTLNGPGYVHPTDLFIGVNYASALLVSEPTREFMTFTQCADNKTIIGMVRDIGGSIADEWIRFYWTGGDDGELIIDDRGSVPAALSIDELDFGSPSSAYQHHQASFCEADLKTLWKVSGNENRVSVYQIDDTGTLVLLHSFFGTGQVLNDLFPAGGTKPSIYADNGLAFIAAGDGLFIFSRLPELASNGVALADVVADICDRSGLAASQIDVTDLNDVVEGFVIGQMMTGRQALEPLRTGYFFDATDCEKLKFVTRGGAVSAEFAFDSLGAGQDEATPTVLKAERQQETELPSRLNVKYLSIAANYQMGAQSARRETTQSRETNEFSLAIVFEDDRAAQIADSLMRQMWAGRTTRTWSTATDYAVNEPTDVATVDDGSVVRQLRLLSRVDRAGLIEWKGVDEDVAAYTSNAVGSPVLVTEQTLPTITPTFFEVLDIPPLTELADGNEAAAYVAARGYSTGWTGARIDISRTGGSTYQTGGTVTSASVMGAATTVLPDFLGGNIFDNSSTVVVDVGPDATLSSATTAEVLNGANGAVIGDEVLQYRTATAVSTGVYTLSGFLRGRKGTEWAISSHEIGDRFVLLTTNLRNLPLLVSDKAAGDLLARATTSGMVPSQGNVKSFDPELARLMPYSPVHLTAVKDASGNWNTEWIRRDRYMNDWNDGVDVPMSEAYERYDVEVLDTGDVVATYVDVTTNAQQVPAAVLGGGATEINFKVYQKSAVVGRGFVAEATIST